MQSTLVNPVHVVQSTTGRTFQLRPTEAADWAGEWPTERTGDVLVTESPGNCDGSVFVYWLGDKTLDCPGVLDAIKAHLDDHDVVGLRVVFAFPDNAHSSLKDDLAELKSQAGAASIVLEVREGIRVRVKRNQGRIGGDLYPGREGVVQTANCGFGDYWYVKLAPTKRAKERTELFNAEALEILTTPSEIGCLPPLTGKQFARQLDSDTSLLFAGASYAMLPHQVAGLQDGWAVNATYPDGSKKMFGERHPLTRTLALQLAANDAMDWWLNRREMPTQVTLR